MLYGSQHGREWVATADYIKKELPAGSSVALAAVAYPAYANQDKRFVDLSGLTNKSVAKLPQKYKTTLGVFDPHWTQTHDPLNNILIAAHPQYVIAYRHPHDRPFNFPGYHFSGNILTHAGHGHAAEIELFAANPT